MFNLSIAGKQKSVNTIEVTTLIENTCISDRHDLVSEHGVSMHIKFGDTNILFDTGSSDKFIKNAGKLNVDISEVDILVISHAHRDHGGGLNHFLKVNSKAKIYMHENVKKEYFYNEHYIGLDNKLLSKFENRITFVNEDTEIIPGVSLLSSFGEKYLKPQNKNLFMKDETTINADNMEHEVILVLKQKEGLVVFSGCSHNGILNMTDAALKQFPKFTVKAVFGGFHLAIPGTGKMAESQETVTKIVEFFQRLPVEKIYTGHCTGNEAFKILKNVLKHKLEPFRTGSVFQI
jgi:7,8-dihydropterin-6-yl-methyl-4-(beta-D-ribofuranosyl)aminobenzene 5'-phosphate synthase